MSEVAVTYNPDLNSHEKNQLHCDESLRLLSINDAKKRMGIRRENLLKLIEEDKIIGKQIGGKIYVPYLSIVKYLTSPDEDKKMSASEILKAMKSKIKK